MGLIQKLPYADDSEIQVLGFLLNYKDIEKIAELESKHFYHSSHQKIFAKILELSLTDIEIDCITVIDNFNEKDLLSVGGASYILELYDHFVTSVNLPYHIERIIDTYKRRELITHYRNFLPELFDSQRPLVDIISNVEDINSKYLQDDKNKKTLYNSKELMDCTIKNVKKCFDNRGEVIGVKTRYKELDDALNGLQPGDLMIVGARPSMGKTAFALNLSERVAERGTIAYFSLEMGANKIGNRLLSMNAFISSGKVAKGKLTEEDILKLEKTSTEFAKSNFFLVDESKINLGQIRAKSKIIKNLSGGSLDLVIIDHLGLIDTDRKENRTLEVGEITKSCKALAKDLGCCVILLSQLSRAVEQRADKRPMLSDLRESGNIEQDADVVIFLYRDEYYNQDSEEKEIMELIIAKNRDGYTGKIKLHCNLKLQLITDEERI